MPAPRNPYQSWQNQPWARDFSSLFGGPSTDQHMRVSDAERQAVTDRLAEHFSSGRLDQEEFDERVSRAMSAKTRADLSGLVSDLPSLKPPQPSAPLPRPPRRRPGLLGVVVFAVLAFWALSFFVAASGRFLWFGWRGFPWPLIALVALFLWMRDRRNRRWHYRREFLDERPQ
jgi:hypothetical protein